MSEFVLLRDASNTQKYGGKASNLARLLQADLAVPGGFAISVEAFDADNRLKSQVKSQLVESLHPDKLYAVRSSALVEDSADASWAGQFETFLNVHARDVPSKVDECHNAIKTRARAYAGEVMRSNDGSLKVAVIVQEMLVPVYTGVLFTEHPVTARDDVVVEYVAGLGDKLVSGEVTPEGFSWNRQTEAFDRAESTIPFAAKELIAVGLKIEKLYGGVPQDIEWVLTEDGIFHPNQARPITT